jgi:hypothetical protein
MKVMSEDKPTDELLFAGEPPLKRYIADRLQNVIERGLESTLTDEQQEVFETQLIEEWQRGPESRAGIEDTVAQFREISEQLDSLPVAKQPYGWKEVGRQLYMYAEKHGQDDPVGQLILNAYKNKKTLLVQGSPPLSRQAAESYVEMSLFFHGIVKRTQFKITPEKREEAVNELIRLFPDLPAEIKEQISQSDIHWGVLRYNWKHASLSEREQFRSDLLVKARSAPSQSEPEKTAETAVSEVTAEQSIEQAELSSQDSASPTSREALAKNSKFIDLVKKLRSNAPKSSPFQSRKR